MLVIKSTGSAQKMECVVIELYSKIIKVHEFMLFMKPIDHMSKFMFSYNLGGKNLLLVFLDNFFTYIFEFYDHSYLNKIHLQNATVF